MLFRTATGLSESLATAVIAIEPSDSAEPSGTVKLQLPSESVVVVPRELPSAKSSTVLPASAVPVKVGVGSLVTELDPELMTGAAIAMAQESLAY